MLHIVLIYRDDWVYFGQNVVGVLGVVDIDGIATSSRRLPYSSNMRIRIFVPYPSQ